MSLRGNLGEYDGQLNEGVKSSTSQGFLWFLKCLSGALFGLTFAIMGQEFIGYGSLSVVFVLITIGGLFCKFSAKWKLATLLIFDLLMVLLALLVRMYIVIAPGM